MIPPHFLPLKSKTGGTVTYLQNKDDICLAERQADHVYKAMEKGNRINTKTMTSEMTQNQDDNPYKRVVLNKVYKLAREFSGNEELVYI